MMLPSNRITRYLLQQCVNSSAIVSFTGVLATAAELHLRLG